MTCGCDSGGLRPAGPAYLEGPASGGVHGAPPFGEVRPVMRAVSKRGLTGLLGPLGNDLVGPQGNALGAEGGALRPALAGSARSAQKMLSCPSRTNFWWSYGPYGEWASTRDEACELASLALASHVLKNINYYGCHRSCSRERGRKVCDAPAVEWSDDDYECECETRIQGSRLQVRCRMKTTGYFHSVTVVCECRAYVPGDLE